MGGGLFFFVNTFLVSGFPFGFPLFWTLLLNHRTSICKGFRQKGSTVMNTRYNISSHSFNHSLVGLATERIKIYTERNISLELLSDIPSLRQILESSDL